MLLDLYPHQLKALERMHNGCVLLGGVGSGKSRVAVEYYMKMEADADVYVVTTARKRDSLDWEREFVRRGVGRDLNGTVAGRLTVDSWNNIGRYRDVENAFFIFDEQRIVGSGEWAKNFIRIAKHNNWILLSATPGDTWLDYIPLFVANGFYKNRSEFKREHVVYNTYSKFPKVDRYTGVGKLVRLRNSIVVPMPYLRHTTRYTHVVEIPYDTTAMEKVAKQRWHVFDDRPLRDVAELFSVSRKVANSDLTRLSTIKTLLQEHPKLIVFYNFDYELDILRCLTDIPAKRTLPLLREEFPEVQKNSESLSSPSSSCSCLKSSKKASTGGLRSSLELTPSDQKSVLTSNPCYECGAVRTKKDLGSTSNETQLSTNGGLDRFQIAEWNGHKHQPVPTTDSWIYLVQYVAGAEAWNCITTDTIVFYSLTYSYKTWEQAYGRIDRLNTPFNKLHYYVLKSSSWIDNAIWKSLKAKENFNESKSITDI